MNRRERLSVGVSLFAKRACAAAADSNIPESFSSGASTALHRAAVSKSYADLAVVKYQVDKVRANRGEPSVLVTNDAPGYRFDLVSPSPVHG